jgi:hypothetical protein
MEERIAVWRCRVLQNASHPRALESAAPVTMEYAIAPNTDPPIGIGGF